MSQIIPKILRVDLSSRKITTAEVEKQVFIDFIGGRGFGAKLAFDELSPGVDALAPENRLIFVTGPLAGTGAQSFGRWKVFFKSPLTGGYFKSSGGGHFGAELHKAGWDVVIIEGEAEGPVYLWIDGDKVEIRDAGYLWGLDCDDTHTLIRELHHDQRIRLACIGPAGENIVRYAGIFSDRRTAARGGGGTLMGRKKLKAIAVRGNGRVEIARPSEFKEALKTQVKIFKSSESFEPFHRQGTQAPEFALLLGVYPVKNFRSAELSDWQELEGSAYDEIRIGKTGCNSCMVRCGNLSKIQKGRYRNWWSEGPEYESIWAFTGPIAKADLGITVAADKLCDDLGLDTISAGGVIAMAYELFEAGAITEKDTDGLRLVYGDDGPVLPLLRKIAFREGIGDLLAEGTKRMEERLGPAAAGMAMHVKGLEFPAYDPRAAKSHGLSMATAVIGADHNCGYAPQELFGEETPRSYDRLSVEEKGELTKFNQDYVSILETGIACTFTLTRFWNTVDLYARLLSAATGVPEFEDPEYLWHVGERIINLERMFNAREGFTREDDCVPDRISKEAMPDGPSKGARYEEDELLAQYYGCRGWNAETGIPSKETLGRLGISWSG